MEQSKKRILLWCCLIAAVMLLLAVKDFFCFSHKDTAKNISINECGNRAYLEEKYRDYIYPPTPNYTRLYTIDELEYYNLSPIELWNQTK